MGCVYMRASRVAHKFWLRSSLMVFCAPWRTSTRPAKAPVDWSLTSVAPALGTFALQDEVETVARNAVVQCDNVVVDAGVGLLFNIYVAHASVFIVGFFQAVEVERGVVGHESFYHLCGEEATVIGSMVAEQEFGFAA